MHQLTVSRLSLSSSFNPIFLSSFFILSLPLVFNRFLPVDKEVNPFRAFIPSVVVEVFYLHHLPHTIIEAMRTELVFGKWYRV